MKESNLDDFLGLFRALGKRAKKGVLLAPFTTLKIGGPAAIFFEARTEAELIKAVKLARFFNVPWLLLGGGSNLLISDQGFAGLVIYNRILGTKVIGNKVTVESGEPLDKLIKNAVSHGLGGIEKMSGIPGTVGGAIFGNAGAYGQLISDHLLRVKVFDGEKTRWLSREECKFAYRESIFQKEGWIILTAEVEFNPASKTKLRKTSQGIVDLRSAKYPKELKCPGSFFKNVLVSKQSPQTLKKIPKEVISHGKIPAGYLLEAVGAKGKQKGEIKIADYHANLFFNLRNGKAMDFFWLAKHFQLKVKNKFGLVLEPEVQLIGFAKEF